MFNQRLVIALGIGCSFLAACRQPPGGPEDGNAGDGDGDGHGDGDGDGDGDGEPGDGDGDGDGDGSPGDMGDGDGDGDGDVYCDLAGLPQLEPMWLEPLPEDPKGKPLEPGLVVTADAIISAGFYVANDQQTNSFATRRDFDGQVQWSVDAPNYRGGTQRSIGWDGQHFYYLTFSTTDVGVRRMTDDGQIDESWSYASNDDLSIDDLDVSGSRVLVAGLETVIIGDPPYDDAVALWIEKLDQYLYGSDYFGEMFENERATAVIPWSAGGHIAALSVSGGSGLFLRGYEGATLSMDTSFLGFPTARFMHERPEGLLVAVDVAYEDTGRPWLMMVNPDGSESWRKPFAPCGEAVTTGIASMAVGPDRIHGVATVEVGPDLASSVIVEFGFDGELQATRALTGAPEGTPLVDSIATNGDVVAISGFSYMPNYVFTGWIARIQ